MSRVFPAEFRSCLLYTSDAADERSSVDLGGRRIIKKNTDISISWESSQQAELEQNESTQENTTLELHT